MTPEIDTLAILSKSLIFLACSTVIAFAWAPLLTTLLYKLHIFRSSKYDPHLERHSEKRGTPVMGGLLVIVTVALVTFFFNWDRQFTWVPVGVMILSALLGGIDDVLNIFGSERRSRKLSQVLTLIKVHKDWYMRLWYCLTLPWALFRRISVWLSRHQGKGVHVHEKLLLQFASGSIAAWWIYYKLAETWQDIYLPYYGYLDVGFLLIPLIIFIVMLLANAVNVADGMDGLAGGMLIPTFGALTILSSVQGLTSMAILNATTTGALIAYTYFNIKPARFQMGDVGSLGLGALLAINALVLNKIVALPFLAFMFIVEIASVIIQIGVRTVTGRRIFKMAPLHYHFELSGWSEEKTIMRFWVVHLFFVAVGMYIALQ